MIEPTEWAAFASGTLRTRDANAAHSVGSTAVWPVPPGFVAAHRMASVPSLDRRAATAPGALSCRPLRGLRNHSELRLLRLLRLRRLCVQRPCGGRYSRSLLSGKTARTAR